MENKDGRWDGPASGGTPARPREGRSRRAPRRGLRRRWRARREKAHLLVDRGQGVWVRANGSLSQRFSWAHLLADRGQGTSSGDLWLPPRRGAHEQRQGGRRNRGRRNRGRRNRGRVHLCGSLGGGGSDPGRQSTWRVALGGGAVLFLGKGAVVFVVAGF